MWYKPIREFLPINVFNCRLRAYNWLFGPKNQCFRNKSGKAYPIQTKFGIRGHVKGRQRLGNFGRDRPILGKMGAGTSPAVREFFCVVIHATFRQLRHVLMVFTVCRWRRGTVGTRVFQQHAGDRLRDSRRWQRSTGIRQCPLRSEQLTRGHPLRRAIFMELWRRRPVPAEPGVCRATPLLDWRRRRSVHWPVWICRVPCRHLPMRPRYLPASFMKTPNSYIRIFDFTLKSADAIIVIWSWYTGRWWVGRYIWYSEGGLGWAGLQSAQSPPRCTNVTANPSTATVPITVLLYNGPLLCGSVCP